MNDCRPEWRKVGGSTPPLATASRLGRRCADLLPVDGLVSVRSAASRRKRGRPYRDRRSDQRQDRASAPRLQDLAAAAGLPPVRLHDLRHGAASLMLAAGVPMKVVQETLGHCSSAITADTNTSVYPTVAADAAEAGVARAPAGFRPGRWDG
jgi:integrase